MTQVNVPVNKWTKVTDSDAKLHIKIPFFTKVFYVESDSDPSGTYPDPKDQDEIKILISPNQGGGFVNVDYVNNGSPLWVYSTGCPLYIIVE